MWFGILQRHLLLTHSSLSLCVCVCVRIGHWAPGRLNWAREVAAAVFELDGHLRERQGRASCTYAEESSWCVCVCVRVRVRVFKDAMIIVLHIRACLHARAPHAYV